MNNPRVLNRAQMKAAEAAADAAGTSYAALMENAGAATAQALLELAPAPATILFLCGSGNNAGDAFVAARLLAGQGYALCWLDITQKGEYSPLAALNLKKLPKSVLQLPLHKAPWTANVLVDAVFGTGFRGQLDAPVREAFEKANAAAGLRVALDIPSGLDCDTGDASPGCFRAHSTLTFGAYKPALLMPAAACYTGLVKCLDIGL